jgi:succinate dehydrogenase/fumarate reductase cytochrome b subunit
MSVARDIVATYRGPGTVLGRLVSGPPREDRALAVLMGACVLLFVAQLPALARQSYATGEDLDMLMGGSLLALIVIAPLLFYALAGLSHLIARLAGGKGTAWQSRMALFWALLAASPLVLLHGLVTGFLGDGPQRTLVGALWFVAFLWFWLSGLIRAHKQVST